MNKTNQMIMDQIDTIIENFGGLKLSEKSPTHWGWLSLQNNETLNELSIRLSKIWSLLEIEENKLDDDIIDDYEFDDFHQNSIEEVCSTFVEFGIEAPF